MLELSSLKARRATRIRIVATGRSQSSLTAGVALSYFHPDRSSGAVCRCAVEGYWQHHDPSNNDATTAVARGPFAWHIQLFVN
jgi:hypothetical protein